MANAANDKMGRTSPPARRTGLNMANLLASKKTTVVASVIVRNGPTSFRNKGCKFAGFGSKGTENVERAMVPFTHGIHPDFPQMTSKTRANCDREPVGNISSGHNKIGNREASKTGCELVPFIRRTDRTFTEFNTHYTTMQAHATLENKQTPIENSYSESEKFGIGEAGNEVVPFVQIGDPDLAKLPTCKKTMEASIIIKKEFCDGEADSTRWESTPFSRRPEPTSTEFACSKTTVETAAIIKKEPMSPERFHPTSIEFDDGNIIKSEPMSPESSHSFSTEVRDGIGNDAEHESLTNRGTSTEDSVAFYEGTDETEREVLPSTETADSNTTEYSCSQTAVEAVIKKESIDDTLKENETVEDSNVKKEFEIPVEGKSSGYKRNKNGYKLRSKRIMAVDHDDVLPEPSKKRCCRSNSEWELKKVSCGPKSTLCSGKEGQKSAVALHSAIELPPSTPRDWSKESPSHKIKKFKGKREITDESLGSSSTPLACFRQFFDTSVIRHIVKMTNKNARQHMSAKKNDKVDWLITEEEMLAYLGLRIIMNIVLLPSVNTYWQKKEWILDYPAPNEIMSRERYRFISRFLYFCDDKKLRSSAKSDKLHQIRPIFDLLLPRFESAYSPGQNLSINEILIPFKGKVLFRQFMHTRLPKYGMKVWVLAELGTGYVSRLQFYTGRISGPQPELGLGKQVLKKLISPFGGLWHRLYVDNFHTSPDLFEHLLQMGVYACGTVRPDQKEFPKDLVIENTRNSCQGSSVWLTSESILAQSWLDIRPIYLMSTFHSPEYETVDKSERICNKDNQIQCPPMVQDFNSKMSGVNLGAQIKKYYSLTRRSLIWHRRIFSYLLEVAISNAQVIFEEATKKKMTGLNFRVQLSKMLIGNVRVAHRPLANPASRADIRLKDVGSHFPKDSKITRVCVVCSRRTKVRAALKGSKIIHKEHSSRSSIKCLSCKVHLCLKQGSTCWKDWHTKKRYWI